MLLPFRYRCSLLRLLLFTIAATLGLLITKTLFAETPALVVLPTHPPVTDLWPKIPELYPREDDSSSARPPESPESPEPPEVYPTESPKRRSLLVYGADRSGTTFISRMFSSDPQVMMVYEPLWVTKKWRQRDKSVNWHGSELGVVNAVLSCNFTKTKWGTKFLAETTRNWAAAPFKNPFTSTHFCPLSSDGTKKVCVNLTSSPHVAENLCLTKYKHSVTKVAQVRAEEKLLSSLVPQVFLDNPDTDVRVLQIIRDPRGFYNSRIKLGWIPDWSPHGGVFLGEVRYACRKISENIRFGRQIASLMPGKYMEARYKDIAMSPIETAQKIYDFAGFEMPSELLDWIIANTNPSKEELEKFKGKSFASVRNSTANVDKWRKESPIERVEAIERECRSVFEFMPDLDMITT